MMTHLFYNITMKPSDESEKALRILKLPPVMMAFLQL